MSLPSSKPAFISTQVRGGSYLFLDLTPRPNTEFAVVCAGREDCLPDYRVERKGFRYHAVEYVIRGKWELTVGGKCSLLGPGDMFAYGPDVDYTLTAASKSGLEKVFVDFTGKSAAGLLKRAGLSKGQVIHIQQSRWLRDLFSQILDCANLNRESARLIGARLTEVLLLRVREDARLDYQLQSESQRNYARCREFIQKHYLSLMSVTEIAERCNLDAAYLSRLFKRYGGDKPLQFLTRLKMDHAAEMLMHQGSSVKIAAAAVGFEDPYHFSRVFKRVHGVAPARFYRS